MAEENKEPTRSVGIFDRAGKKTQEGFANPFTEEVNDMDPSSWWEGEETGVDIPEIDTQVVDLPKENENEKELVVDHKEPAEKTVVEPLLALQDPEIFDDMEIIDPVDVPVEEEQSVDPAEVGEGAKIEKPEGTEENELDETEKPEGKTSATESPEEKTLTEEEKKKQEEKEKRKLARKEARALAQDNLKGFKFPPNWEDWTPKQKADAIKAWNNKREGKEEPVQEEPVQEEPKKEMTKEEALAEARMLAQDNLDGLVIDPKLWSQFTTKEKMDFIKMQMEKNKDDNTYVDEDTTNNYESYKRYPTGLRVAEDAVDVAGDVANRVERVGNKQLAGEGGTSINDAVKQAAIPHYDYRKFFA